MLKSQESRIQPLSLYSDQHNPFQAPKMSLLQSILQNHLEVTCLGSAIAIALIHLLVFKTKDDYLIHGLIAFPIGTILWHIIAVLFGVPLISNMQETLVWAALMSSMTVVAPAAYLGLNTHQFRRIFIHYGIQTPKERWILGIAIGSALGAWLGALPIPLDWERWWQVWPITCLIGSLLGYISSLIILSIISILYPLPSSAVKED